MADEPETTTPHAPSAPTTPQPPSPAPPDQAAPPESADRGDTSSAPDSLGSHGAASGAGRVASTLTSLPAPEDVRERLLAAVSVPAPEGPERITAAATGVPPATLAAALAGLPAAPLRIVLAALGPDRLADVVAALDPAVAVDVLLRLTRPEAADVLEAMDPDDAADVVGELQAEDAPVAEQLLSEMAPRDAADVRQLLAYPDDTAGGIMTTEFLAVRATDTAAMAVRRLRGPADELPPESASYVYVTERGGRLVGVVPWHRLVRAGERVPVRALIEPQTITVLATADQETVARAVHEHRLLAAPVVDDAGRLLGIVTADDVADVIEEETTEDIERLGGSQPLEQPYLQAGPLTLARKRIVWLLMLFAAEAYTGTVLRHFEDELQRVVALTFFIPLLIGTGGNTGSQTVTTVIRAMAVGEVAFRDLFRVWRKELGTALLLAAVMAVAATIRAWTLGVPEGVGLTVAAAAGVIVLWAATVAAILPLVLRRLRVDPAVVSAPLITTLVDGTGLVIYFEIARFVLKL
jgi:magnesium transporter